MWEKFGISYLELRIREKINGIQLKTNWNYREEYQLKGIVNYLKPSYKKSPRV